LIFSSNLKQILKDGDELRDTFEQEENVFNRIKDFDIGVYKNFSKPQKILYYANIVPHVFINPSQKYEFNSYSYSINSNTKDSSVEDSII